jgi:putative ABC transport system permease protein
MSAGQSRPVPPRLASAIVRRLPAAGNTAFLEADLAQEFDEIVATKGLRAARRWYWRQACLSAPPLIRGRAAAATETLTRMIPSATARTVQALAGDLRYAARMARRAPIVTVSVIVAIALGIAATTAMVSVMEAVFLRPLPFPAPDRLVRFDTVIERYGRAPEVNFLDARDWRSSATTFDGIALYDVEPSTVRVAVGASPVAATVLWATADFVAVLGVRPAVGRVLLPEEYLEGGPPALMLSHRYWRSHFGGDPAIVGRTVQLGTERRRIVGVLAPEADRFPAGGADAWGALTFPASSFLNQRGSIALSCIGRLRRDTTMAAAQQEVSTIAARLAIAYPETNKPRTVALEGLQDSMVGPVRPMMLLLAGSIAMLLAVACANIANLLLAQAHARNLEFGIRAAVGASPGRLVRQLWTESLALFGVAGAIGVALSHPLALALIARYPDTLPLASDVALDRRVLAIAVACTLAAALVAGLPRVRRLRDTQAGADLSGGARSGITKEHRRVTTLFVATQVAVSMVLLFGGLLLLRTFMNLTSTAPGFGADGVVTIRASIPESEGDPGRTVAFEDALRETARSLPGVTSAAHAMFIPFTAGAWGDGYRRAGMADPEPRGPMAHFFMVSPEYLAVMHMVILQGRGIAASDDARGAPVLVVSQTFAARAFPGQDPIGRRIEWNDGTWEIVGVTSDVRHASLADPFDADAYVPRRQVVRGNTWLLIETRRPPAMILSELQERVKAIDPDVALTDVVTMRDRIAGSAAPERFRAIVTGTLAALTLVLAIVGLHGVVSYAVAQRTREIGVRLALGQRPASVVRGVMADTLRTIAAGAIPGILASVYGGRWLASIVMVNADTGAALAGVVAIFAAAAIVAAAGPAWRASHVDPIVALRTG